MATEAVRMLSDRAYVDRVRRDLGEVRKKLGGRGASRRAADAVRRVAGHLSDVR